MKKSCIVLHGKNIYTIINKTSEVIKISENINKYVMVRWTDGYSDQFSCKEVRFVPDMLWMDLEDGQNRHIPLSNVRWFSITPEKHVETIK